ncbi:MAG: T9SS type A sorting domain-containing protein, partial [Bacteroidota bacterium]
LNIYYKVDGGSQIAISENTDGFALKTVSANNVSGNSLQVIINGKTSWNDETYNVTNISVVSASGNRQGNAEALIQELVSAYPNPIGLHDNFTLTLGDVSGEKQVVIFDAMGRQVKQLHTDANQLKLNGSHTFTAKGIYLIKIKFPKDQMRADQLVKLVVH